MSKLPYPEDIVYEEVERFFNLHKTPYKLSELGVFISYKQIQIPDNMSLKEYLSKRFDGKLKIIQDSFVKARIFVLPTEAVAQDSISTSFMENGILHNVADIDFTKIPFSLISAFCSRFRDQKRLFFRIRIPMVYRFAEDRPDEFFIEIDKKYQIPELIGKNSRDLNEDERKLIYNSIKEWAEHNSIDLTSLYVGKAFHKTTSSDFRFSEKSALDRLYEAQDPMFRLKMTVPIDIAVLLARKQ